MYAKKDHQRIRINKQRNEVFERNSLKEMMKKRNLILELLAQEVPPTLKCLHMYWCGIVKTPLVNAKRVL